MRLNGVSPSASYTILALEEAIIALWRNKPRACHYKNDQDAFEKDQAAYESRMLTLENMREELYKEAKAAEEAA